MVESSGSEWKAHPDAPPDATPDAPWGFLPNGQPRKRKPRSDRGQSKKPKSSGTNKRKSTTNKPKPDPLYLEKWEAKVLSDQLAAYLSAKFGQDFVTPGQKYLDHLAHVLKRLGSVPPFSFIQQGVKRVASMTGIIGQGPKAGTSPMGDLGQYLYGWYATNPEQTRAAYTLAVLSGKIPPIPGVPLDNSTLWEIDLMARYGNPDLAPNLNENGGGAGVGPDRQKFGQTFEETQH